MAHQVRWIVPDNVVYSAMFGEISMEELREVLIKNRDLIEASSAPVVHIINDTRGIIQAPSLAELIRAVRGYKSHPRTGWVVVVRNANPLLSFISDVGLQVGGMRVRTVKTTADAIEFLKSLSDSIDWTTLPDDVFQYDQGYDPASVTHSPS